MSASLLARLEELSFAEERILYTIQLERGHGGSIGLQVTEGNDGGVYVQAVSVGGSADMAGNINKGKLKKKKKTHGMPECQIFPRPKLHQQFC